MKSLEWVIDIDPPAIIASVAAERSKSPNLSNRKVAERAFSRAQWKATAAGVVTGLPANPWVALPAATLDVAVTLKTEVLAAARTAGMGVTRTAIKKYLSKETLKTFQKIMLKYFGIKITQKGLVTKTLPVVGGLIGGVWNYFEVGQIKKRTIKYFEGSEL